MGRQLRLLPILALVVLALSGCAASVTIAPTEADQSANLWQTAQFDQEEGYQLTVENPYDQATVEQAIQTLTERGVLEAGELEGMLYNQPTSRAMLLRLTVAALELPVEEARDGDCWYAPYIRAGWSSGLFDAAQLSFLPTDGFRTGERGFSQMEQSITREDAQSLWSAALAETPALLQPLSDGEEHPEAYLSLGEALVCTARLLELPRSTLGGSGTALTLDQALADRRIIHAAGLVERPTDGVVRSYTNSAEALANAYYSGARVIELDMMFTSDGELACTHDWSSEISKDITEGEALTLAQWRQVRIYNGFTPLYLDSLADFLYSHPDLYIITDVKDDNVAAAQRIAQQYPDLVDRFIIQIYADREYDSVRALGFAHIIYTLYNLSAEAKMDFDHLTQFAAEHELVAYTYPLSYFNTEGYAQQIAATGARLFVHTVNDAADIQACYDAGIAAVYTDVVE